MSSRCTTRFNAKPRLAFVLFFVAALLLSARAGEKQNDLNGAWVLSGKWTGYMGLALKIEGDHYKYWFASDVGPLTIQSTINGHTTTYAEPRPKYPLRGRVMMYRDVVELRGPGKYYDRKWRRISYCGVTCLLAEQHYQEWKKDGQLPDDRLLFKLRDFDEKRPVLNYGGLEHPDGSKSATSPCK